MGEGNGEGKNLGDGLRSTGRSTQGHDGEKGRRKKFENLSLPNSHKNRT